MSKRKKKKNNKQPKKESHKSVFAAIKMLLKGDTGKEGMLTAKAFALITGSIFRVAVFCLVVALIAFWYAFIRVGFSAPWEGLGIVTNIIALIFAVAGTILALLFGTVLIGMGKDIERETDKNFIIAVFSGLTSFASLVIAVIALVKAIR